MLQVSVDDAAKTFPALLQKVMMGEEIFIIRNQKPIAKLVSIGEEKSSSKKRIKAGSAKGLIKIADDFDAPLQDFAEYMSSS